MFTSCLLIFPIQRVLVRRFTGSLDVKSLKSRVGELIQLDLPLLSLSLVCTRDLKTITYVSPH